MIECKNPVPRLIEVKTQFLGKALTTYYMRCDACGIEAIPSAELVDGDMINTGYSSVEAAVTAFFFEHNQRHA